MAQLAIKGHATRGKEVIETLKMLGGKEEDIYNGNEKSWVYFINKDGFIDCEFPYDKYEVFSLEEFLEKFPYKVGDKVKVCGDNLGVIVSMRWENDHVVYRVKLSKNDYETSKTAENLRPYKEETMEEIKIDIPNGYEFFGIDDDNKIVLTKKQLKYPRTYEECFNICFGNKHHIIQVVGLDGLGDNKELFESFIKLKICRDAYWKIASEQMGLVKPWKPNWHDDEWPDMYYISFDGKHIDKEKGYPCCNMILIFPTKEMRDVFYENFKELIEQCKELL